jgi:peptide/nickel transport system ATP-binding protein
VVEHISDSVLVLNRGRIVESGPAREVLENPQDPYTRELLASVPRLQPY